MNRFPRFVPYQDFKRRKSDDAFMTSREPSMESFVTVVVGKYIKIQKEDKSTEILGIPTFSTFFPPIRLVRCCLNNLALLDQLLF